MKANEGLKIYVNGKIVPSEEAMISVFDSGLNFADGVFEGVRVYAGTVFRLEFPTAATLAREGPGSQNNEPAVGNAVHV